MSTTFKVQLTPTLVNLGTEGSLDTSVSGGVSAQRTSYIEVAIPPQANIPFFQRVTLQRADGATFTTVDAATIPSAGAVTVAFADVVATN